MNLIVTEKSHPLVFETLETISHDVGAGAGHDTYAIPEPWCLNLSVYEAWLRLLTPENQETFCIGEESEAKALIQGSMYLQVTHDFLTAFFNDFEAEPIDRNPHPL